MPTCGVAGVAIAPEHRGRGLLRPLLVRLHEEARAHGEVISTLFASAPGIYASLGYRTVGSMDTIEVAASTLHRFTRQHELRRATEDDIPELKRVYAAWLHDATGVTLALDKDGRALAYAAWNRSPGYGPGAFVEVEDLVWNDDAARDSLLWCSARSRP